MRMRPNPLNRRRMRAGELPLFPERCALRRRFLRPVSRPFRKIRGRPGIAAGPLRGFFTAGRGRYCKKSQIFCQRRLIFIGGSWKNY